MASVRLGRCPDRRRIECDRVINLQSTVIGTDSRIYITQLVWLAAGLVLMFGVALLDVRLIRQFVPIFYVGVIIALVLVLVIGKEVNGSRRWLNLGFAAFQPLNSRNWPSS